MLVGSGSPDNLVDDGRTCAIELKLVDAADATEMAVVNFF
jgi:hypothetical protein